MKPTMILTKFHIRRSFSMKLIEIIKSAKFELLTILADN